LAALTLLAITFWLYKARRRVWFTLLPMLFVLTITLWSLGKLTVANFRSAHGMDVAMVNGLAAAALILLAIFLVVMALVNLRGERKATLTPEIA
jgi:carbon starvation protein